MLIGVADDEPRGGEQQHADVPPHLHPRVEGGLVVDHESFSSLTAEGAGHSVDHERGVVAAALDLQAPVSGHCTRFPHVSILPSRTDHMHLGLCRG